MLVELLLFFYRSACPKGSHIFVSRQPCNKYVLGKYFLKITLTL